MSPPVSTRPASPPSADVGLPWALQLLTFTTGIVDAVSFLGLGHVFTANMTGNVVFIGFSLAGSSQVSAPRSLAAIVAFMAGAVVGGRLALWMRPRGKGAWLAASVGLEVGCLVSAALFALELPVRTAAPTGALYAVVITTSMAMGLRNATAVRLGDPDLKTTVLTLTLTGLAADSTLAGGQNPRAKKRALAVVSLFAGGAAGAALLRTLGPAAALAVMALLVAVAPGLYHYAGRQQTSPSCGRVAER